MLRATVLLLQLTLWVAAVHAFFPFIPDGHCAPDEDCYPLGLGSKRDEGSNAASRVVTVDLHHRPTGTHDPTKTDPVPGAAAWAARKYGRPQPFRTHELGKRQSLYAISEPLPPTASNSAGIYQYGPDYSYFIRAQLGSNKQSMYMLLDTGAANTWMMGSECESDACKLHNTFDASASTSWRVTKDFFGIGYGSGNVSGLVGTDKASFAGLTIPKLSFGLANHVNDSFKHFAFDGILGLGFGNSVTGTFLEALKATELVSSLVVGVSLNRGADGVNDGQVTFGGVDPAKYTGDITYSPIEAAQRDSGEWAIRMDRVSFDGEAAGSKDVLAYIDTGTSFIFAPPADLDKLFKLVPGSTSKQAGRYREYHIPCDTKQPIVLTFSGVDYEISSRDWVMPKGDGCVSNLYGWEVRKGTGSWLLGDTFLKNVYSVFDADKTRIGFAAKSPPPPKPTGTSTVPVATSLPSGATTLAGGDSSHPVMPGFSGGNTEEPGSAETATGAEPAHTHANSGNQVKGGFYAAVCAAAVVAMLG